jgi:hypothetical protein
MLMGVGMDEGNGGGSGVRKNVGDFFKNWKFCVGMGDIRLYKSYRVKM